MARRMLELHSGPQSKFFEAWTEAEKLYTRFGKLGARGQTKLKAEASPEAAVAECERLLAEKLSQGFTEVATAASPSPPEAALPSWFIANAQATSGREALVAAARRAFGSEPASFPSSSDREVLAFADGDEWVLLTLGYSNVGVGLYTYEYSGKGFEFVCRVRSPQPPFGVIRWLGQASNAESPTELERTGGREQLQVKRDESIGTVQTINGAVVIFEVTAPSNVEPGRTEAPLAEREALAQRVALNPNAEEDAEVFADWLSAHGEPAGDLALLFQGGRKDAALKLLRARSADLFGSLNELHREERCITSLKWKNGFLEHVELAAEVTPTSNPFLVDDRTTTLALLVHTFLALPVARCLRSLQLGTELSSAERGELRVTRSSALFHADWSAALTAVAQSPVAAQLKRLSFQDPGYRIGFKDFSALWRAFPRLEHFELVTSGTGEFGTPKHSTLRSFIRQTQHLSTPEVQAIVAAKWPALTQLELWVGSNRSPKVELELSRLFESNHFPKLTSLALPHSPGVGELLSTLARSPLLKRLKQLDLSFNELRSTEAEVLLEHQAAFAHLKQLDLRGNFFTFDEPIRAALPNALM